MIKGQDLARNLIITNGYKLTTLTKKISIVRYFVDWIFLTCTSNFLSVRF